MTKMGIVIGPRIDIKTGLKIRHAIRSSIESASFLELKLATEEAIKTGALLNEDEALRCAICNSYLSGDYCEVCNTYRDESDSPDHDPSDDEQDFEYYLDADEADYDLAGNESDDPDVPAFVPIHARIATALKNLGQPEDMAEAGVLVFLSFLKPPKDLDRKKATPPDMEQSIVEQISGMLGVNQSQVSALYDFVKRNKKNILAEMAEDLDPVGDTGFEVESIEAEIRRSGDEFEVLIYDPYESIKASGKNKGIRFKSGAPPITDKAFIDAKRQRQKNLYNILSAIIEFRKDFLNSDSAQEADELLSRKPLKQLQIATQCQIDASTVSRHMQKLIKTPLGIYRIKDLMMRTAQVTVSEQNDELTVDTVKNYIRKIIQDGDDRKEFYSDEKVTELLRLCGIEYKGNSVRKYRNEMGIANSRERAREKKISPETHTSSASSK